METRSSTVRQATNNEPLVGITVPQSRLRRSTVV
jgi:hypothetical protein